METRLIFVGRDAPDKNGWNWDFQGIFDNPQMAVEAMKDENYFASYVDLNFTYPEDSAEFVEVSKKDLIALISKDTAFQGFES